MPVSSLPFKLTFKGPEVFAFLWQVPKGHAQVCSKINVLRCDSSSALCFGRANVVKTSQHRQARAVWRAGHPGRSPTAACAILGPSLGSTAPGKSGTRQRQTRGTGPSWAGGAGVAKAFSLLWKTDVCCEAACRIPPLN